MEVFGDEVDLFVDVELAFSVGVLGGVDKFVVVSVFEDDSGS